MPGFSFFTCGGGQFWEDVFFYQKWRIQRHYKTKEFRLLDPWDIRRYEGGFEECRQAFLKYITMYQLPRQKGHMIIMLHGLGETKNIFKPLWRKALQEGFLAAAINYPSTRKSLAGHVKQINFLLNHLEDVQEVSFVTHGIGGIILRKMLVSKEPWLQKLKIGRIVQVCPPNQGSAWLTKLSQYAFCRKILGPVISEVSTEDAKRFPWIRKGIETGVISTAREKRGIYKWLPEKFSRYFNNGQEAYLKEAKEIVSIKNRHFNPFKNRRIVNACLNFLQKGKFNQVNK